jgi:hypothetical protein
MKCTICLVCILSAGSTALLAQTDDSVRLMQFKAVFIYNFVSYVQWPEAERAGVFTIGILGNSPLEAPLREISEKRNIEDRKLQVDVYRDIETLKRCHVLFISHDRAGELDEIRQRLGNRSILTVADTPGLAVRGVAINLVLVKGKLKFEINRQVLKQAGLRASAQLLKLAILVEEEGAG